ncbi:hypothetical protein BS47DRAFT_1353969, partial [Hydnum rufescens UP504]
MQARASWSSSLFFSTLMVLYNVLNWGPPSEPLEEYKPAFPRAKVFASSSYHAFTRSSGD